ncbi:MAG: hypothetical protein OEX23_13805 [Betaproteobacteria bacterium]|jgi:hypothetical protein|nr:hypothetical protein [Betaproteobacteria bacterium]
MRRIITVLACAALLNAAPSGAAQDTRLEDALSQYEVGRYEEAFTAFAKLADEGHCEAARIAREMARFGRQLYAKDFELAPARIDRWPQAPDCLATSVATRR